MKWTKLSTKESVVEAMMGKTKTVGTVLPESVIEKAKAKANEAQMTLSAFVAKLVFDACGVPYSRAGWGGDHSKAKTAETHARVCAKMRDAKARKARSRDDDRMSVDEMLRLRRIVQEELERMRIEDRKNRRSDEAEAV